MSQVQRSRGCCSEAAATAGARRSQEECAVPAVVPPGGSPAGGSSSSRRTQPAPFSANGGAERWTLPAAAASGPPETPGTRRCRRPGPDLDPAWAGTAHARAHGRGGAAERFRGSPGDCGKRRWRPPSGSCMWVSGEGGPERGLQAGLRRRRWGREARGARGPSRGQLRAAPPARFPRGAPVAPGGPGFGAVAPLARSSGLRPRRGCSGGSPACCAGGPGPRAWKRAWGRGQVSQLFGSQARRPSPALATPVQRAPPQHRCEDFRPGPAGQDLLSPSRTCCGASHGHRLHLFPNKPASLSSLDSAGLEVLRLGWARDPRVF